MGVMWSYGYFDPFERIDVPLGVSATMPEGLRGLLRSVREMAVDAEEYELSNWEALISDIVDEIGKTLGYESEPDMWDEPTLYDTYGIEYYVMHGLDESEIQHKLDQNDEMVGSDI